MKVLLFVLGLSLGFLAPLANASDRDDACHGRVSCFSALNGLEEELCEAYVEDRSCFSALDGDDQGWCEVLKEGQSCFSSLSGAAEQECENSVFPGNHLYWNSCRDNGNGGG